jgi:hypothetical protein
LRRGVGNGGFAARPFLTPGAWGRRGLSVWLRGDKANGDLEMDQGYFAEGFGLRQEAWHQAALVVASSFPAMKGET